jgi:hypothetical protein
MRRYPHRPNLQWNFGNPTICWSGNRLQWLAAVHKPGPSEVQKMLRELRGHYKESIPTCAVRLGVSRSVFLKWWSGKRTPCSSATRLIWLLWCAALHPEVLERPEAWYTYERPGMKLVSAETLLRRAKRLRKRRWK